ncbi:hypothetical protein GJ496_009304 [Pomphorhynchus laevis]|nr:hypothetical protein GJ496_009304 [Pomphorhynchus laevis]
MQRKKSNESYAEWMNNLDGQLKISNFLRQQYQAKRRQWQKKNRDMLAMYAPDECVRSVAIQDENISISKLLQIASNYKAMNNSPALSDTPRTTELRKNDEAQIQ